MIDTEAQPKTLGRRRRPRARTQAGAVTFADLAWLHYCSQEERESSLTVAPESKRAYAAKLREFEDVHGTVVHAYWSTHPPRPSRSSTSPSTARDGTSRAS